MKRLLLIATLLLTIQMPVLARHIKGGEISYKYLGNGSTPGTDRYLLVLRLFLECNASGQQLDANANFGIYRAIDEMPVFGNSFIVPLTDDQFINLTTPDPCINSPSPVCYRLREYSRSVDLPHEPGGYYFVFQRCCRIDNLINLSPNINVGSSYTAWMGGSSVLGNETNSSPTFAIKDTVLICQLRPFSLDFSAQDDDHDSLSYEFCDAYNAQQIVGGGVIDPKPPSQIGFVSYANDYTGQTPLGQQVSIDPRTGLIKGIAPTGGDYVISVCVKEWRHNKVISEHRKDFNIKVDQQCDLAAALLKPTYTQCKSFTFFFQNESPPSTLITGYKWDFGVLNATNDTSNLPSPSYKYPDTGVYKVKLIINPGGQCTDSSETKVRIYPGFFPAFNAIGSCIQQPYSFRDITTARYGFINSWSWALGDETTEADTSHNRSLTWQYTTAGIKQVSMIVTSSMGCIDTVYQQLDVRQRPVVNLAFRDTLICSVDTLQLVVNGPGNYQWSPNYNIINPQNASPYVYPKQTFTYQVSMNDNGCTNTDSVKVRVVDFVSLNAGPDSTICLTDTVVLRPVTDGLQYLWTPATTLNDPTLKNPKAFPSGNTTYRLTAKIGKCSASDEVTIRTIPYPLSIAGADTLICFEDTATLKGRIKGSRFNWSPASSLSNPTALTTFAYPSKTTIYTLTVYDTLGCPKPGISAVKVVVKDKINAFAGNDTVVVVGQPLQLTGKGAKNFQWIPATYLSRSDIATPIARLNDNFNYILKAYNDDGCFALDTIAIKVFKTAPDIFVPNAFAPNGRNRVLRPIPVGLQRLEYFQVYNRWGQLVFQTSESGKGWDGNLAGRPQQSGSYVWIARGIDYTGSIVMRKGFSVLIR